MTGDPVPESARYCAPSASIWRGAVWVIAGRTLGIVATVLLGIMAPRLMAPGDYAAFTLVGSVVIFAGGLAMFGLNGAMVRFLSERLGQHDVAGARSVLRVGWRVAMVAVVTVAVLTGAYLLIGGLRWFQLPLDPVVAILACAVLVLLAFQQLAAESLRGFHELKLASVLSGGQLGGPITTLLFLAGLLTFDRLWPSGSLTLRVTLGLLAAALVITLPLALISLQWRARRTFQNAAVISSRATNRDELRLLLPVCIPLMVMGGLSFAAGQADLWIAGTLALPDDVALYAAARRLVVMVAMPLQMVNLTIMSLVPSLCVQGRMTELQRLLRVGSWIAAGPAVVCLAIMFLEPANVLGLFLKPFYRNAASYLVILAIGQMALVLAGSCGITLSMTGHHKIALRISLLSAALLVVAGPIAAYRFGLTGLTIVSVASTVVECGLQWYFTRKLIGVWTHCSIVGGMYALRDWLSKRAPWLRGRAVDGPELFESALSGLVAKDTVQPDVMAKSTPKLRPDVLASRIGQFNERPARDIWWLHPSWAFGVLNLFTLLAALILSDESFRLYGTPKYINPAFFFLGLVGIAAFAAGQWLAKSTGIAPAPASSDTRKRMRPWFLAAAVLSIIGYIIWFGAGVLKAHSLAPLTTIWDVNDQSETDIRGQLFPTIPGVTTLTQVGMAAIVLGLVYPAETGRTKTRRRSLIAALIGLAAMRMLLVSERLALIELIIPAVVLGTRLTILARETISRKIMRRLRWAPVAAVAAIAILFGGAEYFRSWRFYQDRFDSFAEFAVWRLSGYYATAHNNGAMAMTMRGTWPMPYYTLEQFWRFPLVVGSPLSYAAVNGFDANDVHMATLDRFGTPELNNEGGLFAPAMDFGWLGYVVYWTIFGWIAGRLHRGFLAGTRAGLLFYPLVFIALLESPLLLYLSSVRSFPSIIFLFVVLGVQKWRSRESTMDRDGELCPTAIAFTAAIGGAL